MSATWTTYLANEFSYMKNSIAILPLLLSIYIPNQKVAGFPGLQPTKKMGRRGTTATSSSSSSLESSSYPNSLSQLNSANLSTDLQLGLSISPYHQQHINPSNMTSEQMSDWPHIKPLLRKALREEANDECNSATFFVKVYMEGIPIGRKLDLLAHDGYHELIRTLDNMFNTNILWAEMECENIEQCHVLTYEDREGDWLIVGDVPWEMFLSSVKRLKITRVGQTNDEYGSSSAGS